jgi:molybdopterin biosynthesis enzyme
MKTSTPIDLPQPTTLLHYFVILLLAIFELLSMEFFKVHFGRIRMKPGKPSTFASIPKQSGAGSCYFFGLPGNPVSCLVCKTLLVDCALKRLQGINSRGGSSSLSACSTSGFYDRPYFHIYLLLFGILLAQITIAPY